MSSLFQRYISELEDRTTDIIALLQIVALSFSECKSKETFGYFKVYRALEPSKPFAYYRIAHCYYVGIGVPQNFKKALAYMSIAISLGHTEYADWIKGNMTKTQIASAQELAEELCEEYGLEF